MIVSAVLDPLVLSRVSRICVGERTRRNEQGRSQPAAPLAIVRVGAGGQPVDGGNVPLGVFLVDLGHEPLGLPCLLPRAQTRRALTSQHHLWAPTCTTKQTC
ncbi:hypothetical protein E2C01_063742 [Portunus trituberculatus]|uniref:Uncharacterized protein n=1 Tax=Portunus trituberculatus TaxID=210409 RepID=A0A5B7HHX1_PORTR|nr:hypothetical protein [Portunus trituberculatus]